MEAEHPVEIKIVFNSQPGVVPGAIRIHLRTVQDHPRLSSPVEVVIAVEAADIGTAGETQRGEESRRDVLVFKKAGEPFALADEAAVMITAEEIGIRLRM